jgi:hypothetical protein
MASPVYKILLFMKRRQGMTREAFREYYETHHVPLALKSSNGLYRYIRRYLEPLPRVETGSGEDLGYDVITELWFTNEQVFKGTVKYLSTSVLSEEIIADEKMLFDRAACRMATAVEYVNEID